MNPPITKVERYRFVKEQLRKEALNDLSTKGSEQFGADDELDED